MSKFKIGDMVIPARFERENLDFAPEMEGLIGKPGSVTEVRSFPGETRYRVHDWWWPKSVLKLAEAGRKPFNLEAALRGDPVQTRDGRKVEEIYLFKTCKWRHSLHVAIDGVVYAFTKEGRFPPDGNDNNFDLFMAPRRVEYWVNVYRGHSGGIYTSTFAYGSEREAKDNKGGGECISQVKVWEEMI